MSYTCMYISLSSYVCASENYIRSHVCVLCIQTLLLWETLLYPQILYVALSWGDFHGTSKSISSFSCSNYTMLLICNNMHKLIMHSSHCRFYICIMGQSEPKPCVKMFLRSQRFRAFSLVRLKLPLSFSLIIYINVWSLLVWKRKQRKGICNANEHPS